MLHILRFQLTSVSVVIYYACVYWFNQCACVYCCTDDRPVRESEREAATSLFTASESGEKIPNESTKQSSTKNRRIVPSGTEDIGLVVMAAILPVCRRRVFCLSGRGVTMMDADDCAVLNFLTGEQSSTNGITPSAVPAAEDYQLKGENDLSINVIVHTMDYSVIELKELAEEELSSRDTKLHSKQVKSVRIDDRFTEDKTQYYQSKYPNIPAHRLGY